MKYKIRTQCFFFLFFFLHPRYSSSYIPGLAFYSHVKITCTWPHRFTYRGVVGLYTSHFLCLFQVSISVNYVSIFSLFLWFFQYDIVIILTVWYLMCYTYHWACFNRLHLCSWYSTNILYSQVFKWCNI